MMFRLGFGLVVAALLPTHASAADVAAGKALVNADCQHCHGNEMYKRQDRRVGNLAQLRSQVRRCELSLELKWFDDDIDNAAAYLNQQFYQFK